MRLTTRNLRLYPWHIIVPVVVYLLLCLAGVSQSSLGVGALRSDPDDPTGVTLGTPRDIRSDEFLTSTPFLLNVLASGSTDDGNPLAGPQHLLTGVPSGPVSSVVLEDASALRLGPWLPDDMLYAARWWLPFLALAIAAPSFFGRITGSRSVGYLAAGLIALSPASAWWSFAPLQVIAWALSGAAVMLWASAQWEGGRSGRALLGVGFASLLLARTLYGYQPWSVMFVPLIAATATASILLVRHQRRRPWIVVGGVAVLSFVLVGAILWESRAELAVATGTVYPGSRRASGAPNPIADLLAATNLEALTDNAALTGTNASEISSSFTVAFAWVALLLASGLTYRVRGHRAALIVAAVMSAFWLSWSMVDFGSLGARLPLANLVPSVRAGDVVGFLAVLLLCLALPVAKRTDWPFALMCAAISSLLVAYGGSALQTNMPSLSTRAIWWSTLVTGLVVLIVTRWPRSVTAYAVTLVAALSLVWDANPVQVGLGDLRESAAAHSMLRDGAKARAEGSVWASDSAYVDSLMISTGVPSVSGRQVAGPSKSAWRALDPDGSHKKRWNRGGAFIWLVWTDQPTLTWDNPSQDVIYISGSPCVFADRLENLSSIVSKAPLALPCLEDEPRRTFTWAGSEQYVYDVRR